MIEKVQIVHTNVSDKVRVNFDCVSFWDKSRHYEDVSEASLSRLSRLSFDKKFKTTFVVSQSGISTFVRRVK